MPPDVSVGCEILVVPGVNVVAGCCSALAVAADVCWLGQEQLNCLAAGSSGRQSAAASQVGFNCFKLSVALPAWSGLSGGPKVLSGQRFGAGDCSAYQAPRVG